MNSGSTSGSRTRRLAVLGWTDETSQLLSRWLDLPDWNLVGACSVARDSVPAELLAQMPHSAAQEDWLDGVDADVIVVSPRESGEFDELLRRLAGTGVPMVLLHPACDSLMAHELQMLYPAAPAPLWVWYPQRRLHWEEKLREQRNQAVSDSTGASRCERIVWTVYDAGLTESSAKCHLTRASHWCAAFAERWATMQARCGPGESVDWNKLSATIESHQGLVLEWRIKPPTAAEPRGAARVELECGNEQASYTWLPEPCQWEVDPARGMRWPIPESLSSSVEILVRNIEQTIDGANAADDWVVVCQSLEVADQVEYTLRRRRVVDLVQETPSEEAAFKGVMAAGSCALLMIVLAVFAIGSLYESVARDRPRPGSRSAAPAADSRPDESWNWWRFWPALPLVVYLLLQLLLLVARQGGRGARVSQANQVRPKRE